MQLLARTPHPNVVALKHSHIEEDAEGTGITAMVMPMYPMSLNQLIEKSWAQKGHLSQWKAKLWLCPAEAAPSRGP